LLLTAGFSKRMGKPKALLIQDGLPFAIVILLKMNTICDRIVVVVGHSGNLIQQKLEHTLNEYHQLKSKVEFITNENYQEGMFTSLQCGLRKVINSEWILYHFVDQPKLNLEFYNNFCKQIGEGFNWLQPQFEKNNGHPILFHKSVFKLILELSPNSSLRNLSNHPGIVKKFWECNYPEVLQDIDTPSDL
jgi:molybdenum cofactor cytidylyltransferase